MIERQIVDRWQIINYRKTEVKHLGMEKFKRESERTGQGVMVMKINILYISTNGSNMLYASINDSNI